ncbi:MerR family transcriptional regulator [Parafrankia sp. FMc2]
MKENFARIGEAAALFGLAPSTLRWWERQGVVSRPGPGGSQRLYCDLDLRRIGLAYLCCITGGMPLESAAVVTSTGTDAECWQRTVREKLSDLDRQIERMKSAREYLSGLLRCSDDDPVQCPYLDAELLLRTPRGRFPTQDLVSAARSAAAGSEGPPRPVGAARPGGPGGADHPGAVGAPVQPDTLGDTRQSATERTPVCAYCAGPLAQASRGRPRQYCTRACQQQAYRVRRREGRGQAGGDRPARRSLPGHAEGPSRLRARLSFRRRPDGRTSPGC